MPTSLPPSAQKVQAALRQAGYAGEIMEVPHSTRTAAEAAVAVECNVAQIVKSLVATARAPYALRITFYGYSNPKWHPQ